MFLIAVVSVVQGMNRYMTDKFAGTILGVNTFRLRQFPGVQLGNVTDSTWRVSPPAPPVARGRAHARTPCGPTPRSSAFGPTRPPAVPPPPPAAPAHRLTSP